MADAPASTHNFKVPFFPVKRDESTDNIKSETIILDQNSKKKAVKPQVNVPLPYKEPEWSGFPPPNYYFEIIKNGTVVSTLPIKNPFIVFGRLEVCDAVFEHPSVSRYHAIVQYCKGDDTHPKGFYLYDLGSTHNTFLNKSAVNAKVYYKLEVGYILKFGGSSRLHIFQGPEEEEEVEVKNSVEKKSTEEEGCSWGMDEDSPEEDDEGSINPFAISTPNEDLYLDDPKKTLRGWFEREGYEVEYKVEEKAYKTFSCTLQLPIDTPTGEFLTVEASVNGKKKEAVAACALEACRTLDRMGLLRQSHHESRQKKKRWEENDYYDSDEDTFYDRTGEIEKRREMRKRLNKKREVENFQSLEAKLVALVAEIEEINKKNSAYTTKNVKSSEEASQDSLESYMSSLTESSDVPKDKFEKRKLQLRLIEAEKEKSHLEKLLDIARPAKLPPVVKHSGIIGKKLKSKLQLLTPKPEVQDQSKEKIDETAEEVDSDSETETAEKSPKVDSNLIIKEPNSPVQSKKYGLIFNAKNETSKDVENEVLSKETTNVSNTPVAKIRTSDMLNESEKNDSNKIHFQSVSPAVKRLKKDDSKTSKSKDVYKTNTDYCTWTPPSNQSGDGITHLNAKYGY